MRHHRATRTAMALAAAATLALSAAPAPAQRPGQVFLPRAARLAAPTADCDTLPVPQSVRSSGGVLNASLTMAPATFQIGTTTLTRNVYNGQYVAPVLRVNPTDSVNINVTNSMKRAGTQTDSMIAWTNQHYHGMIVTPIPKAGDNVVPNQIDTTESNVNAYRIPPYQSQGLMWYHPHPHGITSPQVGGGLAGAMITGDLLSLFPAYRGATERVMYVKDTSNDQNKPVLNINGNTCTRINARPGEQQLWRVGNMGANTYVNLKLEGYRFTVLAMDGNKLARPTEEDSIFLGPGSRAEFIVTGGAGPWVARLYSDSIATSYSASTGAVRKSARVDLGFLVTSGVPPAGIERSLPRAEAQAPDMALVDSIRELLTEDDVNTDTIRYQQINGKLVLNGVSYDPSVLNMAVPFGQVQEYTLINETTFLHTYHIHQVDFVVTEINGVPQADSVHLDNVHLGIHQNAQGQWTGDVVKIRFKFNPIAAGPFVYHCHVLSHEDAGMMGNYCVYDPRLGPDGGKRWCEGFLTGGGGHTAH